MDKMRILITGSRYWSDSDAILKAIADNLARLGVVPEDAVIIHGDCETGADALTQSLCELHGFEVERYPAEWLLYGKKAGPIRNQQMVDLTADVCLAFPLPNSRGTVDCMRRARDAGIVVHNYGTL